MKNLKNIIAALLIFSAFNTKAGLPNGTSPFAKDNTVTVNEFRALNTNFVLGKKKQTEKAVFTGMLLSQFDAGFITGAEKKEESKLTSLLNFDFKVKFKLNRNMNIIFSYN